MLHVDKESRARCWAVKRKGGGVQATYNGHPLYTDAGAKAFGLIADKKPGDLNGQGFLSIWYVLSPKGHQSALVRRQGVADPVQRVQPHQAVVVEVHTA